MIKQRLGENERKRAEDLISFCLGEGVLVISAWTQSDWPLGTCMAFVDDDMFFHVNVKTGLVQAPFRKENSKGYIRWVKKFPKILEMSPEKPKIIWRSLSLIPPFYRDNILGIYE